jgi:hypothetical protein
MRSTPLSRRNSGTRELTRVPERKYFEPAPLLSTSGKLIERPVSLAAKHPLCAGQFHHGEQ